MGTGDFRPKEKGGGSFFTEHKAVINCTGKAWDCFLTRRVEKNWQDWPSPARNKDKSGWKGSDRYSHSELSSKAAGIY